MLSRIKWDRDEMRQECSSLKCTSIDGVGFSIWRHTFNVAAMTSLHTEKCCHQASGVCSARLLR